MAPRRAHAVRTLLLALGAGVCSAAASGSDLAQLRARVEQRPEDALARFELALALPLPEQKEEALGSLEQAIVLDPANMRFGNEYRRACMRTGEHQRAIEFLERQVAVHPEAAALHLNLALAYVDKMPTAGLAIVGQGLLSNRSIRELDKVLQMEPRSWTAMYGRAMNHLHWPRALLHASQAIEDFRRCLKLQEAVPAAQLKAHHVLPYLGLGDAYVKNNQLDEARRTWREAERFFPGDARLVKRLALVDDELKRLVENERGLARPIDTDLAFLWAP